MKNLKIKTTFTTSHLSISCRCYNNNIVSHFIHDGNDAEACINFNFKDMMLLTV